MLLPIAYEGEGRDGYRDQIVTCDVGVSLNSKTHHEVQQWHKHTVLCISLSELVSCAFSTIPICPFLIQRIFHSLGKLESHYCYNIESLWSSIFARENILLLQSVILYIYIYICHCIAMKLYTF